MPYYQLYYHIVTATRRRTPLITPQIEPMLYEAMRMKINSLEGEVYAINGMADHVHLVVSIPPKIAVATLVGQAKGYSSTQVNNLGGLPGVFVWQEDYSVFSFDHKRLPNLIAYVDGQKSHHADGTLIPVLERCEEPPKRAAEESAGYDTGDLDW